MYKDGDVRLVNGEWFMFTDELDCWLNIQKAIDKIEKQQMMRWNDGIKK